MNKSNKRNNRIRVVKPETENGACTDITWQEVQKFAKLVPFEPDPNLGRVREIKEELRKGFYPSHQMIEEAASQLLSRWKQEEDDEERRD